LHGLIHDCRTKIIIGQRLTGEQITQHQFQDSIAICAHLDVNLWMSSSYGGFVLCCANHLIAYVPFFWMMKQGPSFSHGVTKANLANLGKLLQSVFLNATNTSQ